MTSVKAHVCQMSAVHGFICHMRPLYMYLSNAIFSFSLSLFFSSLFQGAVESIAMKTPKERTQLFEQISR